MDVVSKVDVLHYKLIREGVSSLVKEASVLFDKSGVLVLDVAPHTHLGVREHFLNATVRTLDLNPNSGADYVLDLCTNNSEVLSDNTFDVVFCTEVLEHTDNPFSAANELVRLCKVGGYIYVTTPFNFRIHNPLPDNWRFTVYGLKKLFKNVTTVKIEEVHSDRFLAPVQYKCTFKKEN